MREEERPAKQRTIAHSTIHIHINSLNNKHSKEKIRFHRVLERSVNRAADSEILLDLKFCLQMMFLILKVQQN